MLLNSIKVYRIIGQNITLKRPGNIVLLADFMKCNTSTPDVLLELLLSIALSFTQAIIDFIRIIYFEIRLEIYETINKIKQDIKSFLAMSNSTPEKGDHFMSRVVLENHPHHITQRGVRSMDIFFNDTDRLYYLEQLKQNCKEYDVIINGYCLMTNHVHLILTPLYENSLSFAIRETHKAYTRRINFREGAKGHLFQGRFFSCALDDQYYVTAMRYVERNPVKAGITRVAWTYRWSSAAYHSGVKKTDDYLREKDNMLGTTEQWKELLKSNPEDIEFFKKRTRTGRPCGAESFLKLAERMTGRELIPRPAGRPKRDHV